MSDKFELGDVMAYILKDRKSCFNAGIDVGKKQGALEELKKALLLSTTLNDKDIESYLNHRIKELEGCEKQ